MGVKGLNQEGRGGEGGERGYIVDLCLHLIPVLVIKIGNQG